jgi:hypothetical protein
LIDTAFVGRRYIGDREMTSTELFQLSFRFYPVNLAPSDEKSPIVRWWSSTIRDYRKGVVDSEPMREWEEHSTIVTDNQNGEDEGRGVPMTVTRSKAIRVDVPVDLRNLKIDDAIEMEVIAQSPNHENKLVGARCGSSGIMLYNLYKVITNSENVECKFVSRHQMVLITLGQGFLKGYMEVTLLNGKSLRSKMKFETPGNMYSMIPPNSRNLSSLVHGFVVKDIFPYNDAARKMDLYFEASSEDVARIQAPLWANVETVPGMFYWVDYSPTLPDENFMSNASKIALERAGMGSKEFIDIVDTQFRETGSTYHDSFNDAVRVTSEMLCLLANALRYKSDETFIPRRESSIHEEDDYIGKDNVSDKVSVEAFNDAYMLKGGDCEDLGNLIHRICRILEVGHPDHRSESVLHRKRGGWSDPVLDRMQMISHIYVGGGALGSVTSRYLGEEEEKKKQHKPKRQRKSDEDSDDDDDEETENALIDPSSYVPQKSDPIIIDSERDRNVEFGGHMWWEWHPLKWFEECIHRTNPSVSPKFSLYPQEVRRPWEDNLPVAIGEGTGYMDPLLKPLECYYSDKNAKERAKDVMERKSEFFTCFVKRFMAKNKIQNKMGQFAVEDVEDARLSKFYRKSSSFFTDKLMLEGFNFGKFTWTLLNGERMPDGEYSARIASGKPVISNDPSEGRWRWGVNLRERVFKREYLGLVVNPGYTKQELDAVKSIMRHLPPLKCPYLSMDMTSYAKNKWQPKVDELKRKLMEVSGIGKDESDSLSDSRNSNSVVYPIHMILRDDDIFDEKLKNRLIKSVSKMARGLKTVSDARDKYGNRDVDQESKRVRLRYYHKIDSISMKVEPLADDIVNVRLTINIKSKNMTKEPRRLRYQIKKEGIQQYETMVNSQNNSDDRRIDFLNDNMVELEPYSLPTDRFEQEIILKSPSKKRIDMLKKKYPYMVILNWSEKSIDVSLINESNHDGIILPYSLREIESEEKQVDILHVYTFESEESMSDFLDFMDNHVMQSAPMIEGIFDKMLKTYKPNQNDMKIIQKNAKELHKMYEHVKHSSKNSVISLVSKFKKIPQYVYKSPVYKRSVKEASKMYKTAQTEVSRASKYAQKEVTKASKYVKDQYQKHNKIPNNTKIPTDYYHYFSEDRGNDKNPQQPTNKFYG